MAREREEESEKGAGMDTVFTNPDKEPGRHVGEKRSGVVYRFPVKYLTARQRNLLSTWFHFSCRARDGTRLLDRRHE